MADTCSNLPHYNLYKYTFDPTTNKYNLSFRGMGKIYLPDVLKLERTFSPKIKADYILRGETNSCKLFTGLRPEIENVFSGDHVFETKAGKRVKSFLLFEFNETKELLTVYYFKGITKFANSRTAFICSFLNQISKN